MYASEVFLAARDEMRERGWAKEKARDKDGKVCLRGSLMAALDTLITSPGHVLSRQEMDNTVYLFNCLDNYCFDQYGNNTIAVNDLLLNDEDEAVEILEGASKWVVEKYLNRRMHE